MNQESEDNSLGETTRNSFFSVNLKITLKLCPSKNFPLYHSMLIGTLKELEENFSNMAVLTGSIDLGGLISDFSLCF